MSVGFYYFFLIGKTAHESHPWIHAQVLDDRLHERLGPTVSWTDRDGPDVAVVLVVVGEVLDL